MIEYTTDRRRPAHSKILTLMVGINVGIALVALSSWAVIRLTVAQPLSWATSQIVGENPDFLDYPFVLLWALPILAVLVARGAAKWGAREMALGTAVLPPLLFATVMITFYYGPSAWR